MNMSLIRAVCGVLIGALPLFAQGPLTPPGAPAPTLKTLEQIEPRTPIFTPGLIITNGGSYYLTRNLISTNTSTSCEPWPFCASGITIQADNVTVDLNGSTLLGRGFAYGVFVSGRHTNIVVRNGIIRRWGTGIEAMGAQASRFEQLQISHCAGIGLFVGDDCLIQTCTLYTNGSSGVEAGRGLRMSDSVAAFNILGIMADHAADLGDCTARFNRYQGILAGQGSLLMNCIAEYNGQGGIAVSGGVVKDCVVRFNTTHGITAQVGSQIIGNHCVDNGNGGEGAGIMAVADPSAIGNRIEGNHVARNDWGIACNPATGNLVIRNSAKANGIDYNVVAGNTFGPIITSADVATNPNPHANYVQ
jgi:parallel beta-helix repeat protein